MEKEWWWDDRGVKWRSIFIVFLEIKIKNACHVLRLIFSPLLFSFVFFSVRLIFFFSFRFDRTKWLKLKYWSWGEILRSRCWRFSLLWFVSLLRRQTLALSPRTTMASPVPLFWSPVSVCALAKQSAMYLFKTNPKNTRITESYEQ